MTSEARNGRRLDPLVGRDNAEILNWRACRLKLVEIRWRDPASDWPYFVVLRVHGPLRSVLLRGADFPDGSAKHDGDEFWINMDEVAEFSRVQTPNGAVSGVSAAEKSHDE